MNRVFSLETSVVISYFLRHLTTIGDHCFTKRKKILIQVSENFDSSFRKLHLFLEIT